MELILSILSGGATGILGTALSAVFSWLREKEQHKRELDLRKLDMIMMEREAKLAERQHELAAEREETRAEYETLRASYAEAQTKFSEGSRSGWLIAVDVVRGLMRPLLTTTLVALTGAIYFSTTDGDLRLRVVSTILYLATAATLWWFGSRQIEKAMKVSK